MPFLLTLSIECIFLLSISLKVNAENNFIDIQTLPMKLVNFETAGL